MTGDRYSRQHNAMDKKDAQWGILRAWDIWAEDNITNERLPDANDAEKFYRDLVKNQPELLAFKSPDKWASVHEYLRRHHKVVN